jgi:DnaD/phage-associated family protein
MVRDNNLSEIRSKAGKKGGKETTKKKEDFASDFAQAKVQANTENEIVIEDVNINNNIYSFIEENFGRTLSSIEYQEIGNWEDNELTRYAIQQSVLNGKYNIKYIQTILRSYKTKNITTIQQAQEDEDNFKIKKDKQYRTSSDRTQEVFDRFLKGEEHD